MGELREAQYRRCDAHPLPGAHEVRPIPKEVMARPESYKEALLDAERELAEMDHRRRNLRVAVEGLRRLVKGEQDDG